MTHEPKAPGGDKSWTVEYQQETVDLDSGGRAVQGVKVGFVTGHGVHASVFVPKATYNAHSVRQAILAAVEHIDAVHNLQG